MTKESDNDIPNQPELVTANSDSEEAPDNLVMTRGMQGINSMAKKDDTPTGIPSKLEEVRFSSDDLKETPDNVIIEEMQAIISAVAKENDKGIPNQLELVTASSDSKDTPDNLVMI